MGPYLSVIADSFRAASSSRILWIALFCVGIFLVALAPLGYRENTVATIGPSEIVRADRLLQRLTDGQQESPSPESSIAAALSPKFKERLQQAADTESAPIREEDIAEELNQLIDAETDPWFDEEIWQETTQLKELRDLNAESTSDLTESLKRRRSRLRLEAGLRGEIRPRPEKTISIVYAIWETPIEWPLPKTLFHQVLVGSILPVTINGLLGFVGIILGILVTAPMLPEMLQPGSLHLLLSKPISRPLLYLSKFVGGCAFMFLCVGPLLSGVWLILGWRFDLWLPGLFYCIPVYMLLFMVYYSVSCLVALQWKSAIASALLSIGFWVACGALGLVGVAMEATVSEPAKIEKVAHFSDDDRDLLISTTKPGLIRSWQSTTAQWQDLPLESYRGEFVYVLGPIPIGPDQYALARKSATPMGLSGKGDLTILDLSSPELPKARRSITLPHGTTEIFATTDNGMIAAGPEGLYFATAAAVLDTPTKPPTGGGFMGQLSNLLTPTDETFRSILPRNVYLRSPMAAQMLEDDQMLVYSAGILFRLVRESSDDQADQWTVAAKRNVEGNASSDTKIAANQSQVALYRSDEPIRFYDRSDLQLAAELELPSKEQLHSITGNPQASTFLILQSDQTPLQIKGGAKPSFVPLPENMVDDSIEYLQYDAAGNLLVAYDIDSLQILPPDDGAVEDLRPNLSNWRRADRYLVQPARYLIPQTGELRAETIRAALQGDTTQTLGEGLFAEKTSQRLDVQRPVFTCLGFTALMLLIGCIKFARQDY